MNAQRIGLWAGLVLFFGMLAMPNPDSMSVEAWKVAALTMS